MTANFPYIMFINFILAEVSLEEALEDSAVTSFVAIDFSIIWGPKILRYVLTEILLR